MESDSTCIVQYLVSCRMARTLIDAGIAEADRLGHTLSFAVVDSSGHLVASARMDGAPFVSVEIARGKAFASAATGGQPGDNLDQRYRENPMVWGNAGPLGYGAPMLPAVGSLPIKLDGRVIGAIGASGAPSAVDVAVITATLEAVVGPTAN
ncbi:heme-binding protein [Sphingomonas sp. QA11]|uniref:GlcG/HbpS family heme-binding protein n=1 Tax=Sphingomonas sp. QA11 TaxID=2950605 RepID=UPI0023498780|nr:heme-binding protein [Sphingomonas sp. QA11]WCM28585.1 heme-binding protein [Sphingomonas sp. QA11]